MVNATNSTGEPSAGDPTRHLAGVGTRGDQAWPPEMVRYAEARREFLISSATLICGRRSHAEEALHDALVAVRGRWDDLDEPEGYLFRAVVNRARDLARKHRREELFDEPPASTASTGSLGPANAIAEADAMQRALATVSERQRTALALRYFADQPHDSIADIMDCPTATVRSLVARGLKALQQELEEDR